MDRADLVVKLGSSVVKAACKIWAGPFVDIAEGIVDLIRSQVDNRLEQRRAERFFDQCIDAVAKKTLSLLDDRSGRLPENEIFASMDAVRDTVDAADLSAVMLVRSDLDPRMLERRLLPVSEEILKRAALSEGATALYSLVLRESCAYMMELVTTLPDFQTKAFSELLQRDTAILETLQRVLYALPARRNIGDFSADYRRLVINRLDRMELFGVGLSYEASRQYPLSVAYISVSAVKLGISMSGKGSHTLEESGNSWRDGIDSASGPLRANQQSNYHGSTTRPNATSPTAGETRVEDVLANERRVLLIGEAGSGKTTILHWLSVRSARSDFTGVMNPWNQCTPFLIPLRSYVNKSMPTPEMFPMSVGRNIADEMPESWVHNLLRSGDALILVDGVDELQEGHARTDARNWLLQLVSEFPNCRYVVTSRPAAVTTTWLTSNGFATAELQPMSPSSVRKFVEHWHDAVSVETRDKQERDRLEGDQKALLSTIEVDRHLRDLCINPLLCALLCALNRERRRQLPRNRMGVYRAALEMLVDLRDKTRGVSASLTLSFEDKTILLQDLALFLVRNGLINVTVNRAQEQIGRSLRTLHHVSTDTTLVLQSLLERSGILRQPTVDRIDFVHRSFQEYLAGKAAAENDDIGFLLSNAHNDQLWDVIIMAAGHAQPRQRTELLRGLLGESPHSASSDSVNARSGARAQRTKLLAIACLQTAPQLDPALRKDIELAARRLVPPESIDIAPVLASVGAVVLDLLYERPPTNSTQAAASIRVAAMIGGIAAMDAIASIASSHDDVDDEVIRSWNFFETELYASRVLSTARFRGQLTLTDFSLLPHIHHIGHLEELFVKTDQFSVLYSLPPRPASLGKLRIYGGSVQGPSGIERWNGLTHLDIDMGHLAPPLYLISDLTSLEFLRISSTHKNSVDLDVLNSLRMLRVVQLDIPNADHFRLGFLTRMDNVSLFLPPNIPTSRRGFAGKGPNIVRTTIIPKLW